MEVTLTRKFHSLRRTAPGDLFPVLTSVFLIAAVLFLLLNGYNDYREQMRKVAHNENLAEKKLNLSAQVDHQLQTLQQNVSALFKPQQHQPALLKEDENSQRYALTANPLTDDFYLSCPPATFTAHVAGLLSGDDIHKSIAVIHYRDREASYGIADSLDEGINIVRIFPDRVIVNEHGYCAALLMN